jgi:rod shape-determining protein MreD
MKSCLIWGAVLIGAYVLQSGFFPLLAYHGISVDLLLLSVMSFGLLKGSKSGVLMGFMAGVLQDAASGTFFGMNIFSKMIIGYLCGSVANRVFKEQFFLPICATVFATLMNYFILAVIVLLLGYRFNLIVHLRLVLLPMLLYNIVFAFPVHTLFCWLCEKVKEK